MTTTLATPQPMTLRETAVMVDDQAQAQPATELPTIDFVVPIPGFAGHQRFVLVRMDDEGVLFSLRSVDDQELRFLVVAPPPFFPDYAPEIDDDTLEMLGTDDPSRLLVLLIVTAAEAVSDSTVNLLAPIVIDQLTRRAVQTVLTGSEFPVRAPLLSV